MRRFVTCMWEDLLEEFRTAMLHDNMDLERLMVHAQQVEKGHSKRRVYERNSNANMSDSGPRKGNDQNGLEVDPKKVEAANKRPRPLTPIDVQSILGLANYYRRSVEGFSTIAAPFIALMKKTVKFEWSENCEKSFEELKYLLTSARVLTLTRSGVGYVVYCDASHVGLECNLMQDCKVIAYASRQLKIHEKNYRTHDLKSAAMVFSLKLWRQYLYGVHIDVYTNYKSLQYVFKHRDLNLRKRRWQNCSKIISVYYNLSKANVVAHAFSRLSMGVMSHIDEEKKELVKEVQQLARFGVRLEDAPSGGVSVHSSFESSFVVNDVVHVWGLDSNRDTAIPGPEIVHEVMENARMIRDRLATTYSHQKSFVDNGKRALEFEVGNQFYLRISSMKGVMRFGEKVKLSLRYLRPYDVLQRVGNVDYELMLPQDLVFVHLVFHVSLHKKCLVDPASILVIEGFGFNENLSYEEVPIEILDCQVKILKNKEVSAVKVLW
ncbi:uncharacterized protein [Solanum lycopersicum]|uniref:uncharacterized protein n=1 Tax=Solanum lycopersicum TaxID=4081 RepID=UPI003748EE3D